VGPFVAIMLVLIACVARDDDPDGQPVVATDEPSAAVTTLPGTATEAAQAPSATSFLRPTSEFRPTEEEVPAAIENVVATAAAEQGVSVASVRVISYEQQSWPSTALGCPEAGRSYAQILTSGFRVMVLVDGLALSYHVDEAGTAVIQCDQSAGSDP
jgi:hypothetical protein